MFFPLGFIYTSLETVKQGVLYGNGLNSAQDRKCSLCQLGVDMLLIYLGKGVFIIFSLYLIPGPAEADSSSPIQRGGFVYKVRIHRQAPL